jgi:hypothetical protein
MAQDINALNQEIANLRRQLGDKPLTPFDSKDLDKALLTVKALRQEFREVSSDLDYINKSFKDSVNEMSRQNIYLNTAKKSLNGIADISKKVADYRRGENVLSEKQLSTLKDQARVKFEELKLSIRSGQLDKDNLRDAQAALNEQEAFNRILDRTIELQEKVNKDIGLMGSGLEGAGKFLEKMGFAGIAKPISDAIQKTKDARLQIELNKDAIESLNEEYQNTSAADVVRRKELRDQIGSLKSQNKELDTQSNKYKNIASSLKEQLTTANFLDFVLVQIVKSFLKLDTSIGNTAKSMGISYNEAAQLSQQFNNIANSSGNIFVTTEGISESFNQINAALGTNANLNEELLLTQTELTKQAFYSVEAATEISKLSLATGQSSKNIVTSFLGQAKALNLVNNTAINEKQLIEGISKTSKGILATFAAQPKKLIEAAFAAKKIGLELNEIKGIQDSLLNIESSIASEFEAEVLTGKQMNLERARYYALTNNIAGLSQELTKQGIDQTKFAGMNVLQQESVAQAMGLSRDQLGEMLLEQAALSKLTGGDTEENRRKLALLKEQGFSTQAIAELGQDELDRQMKSASTQDKFNASIEKLKEIFVSLAEPLMSILGTLSSMLSIVGLILKPIAGLNNLIEGLMGSWSALGKVILSAAIAAGLFWTASTGGLGGLAILAAGAAVVGGIMTAYENAQTVQDGIAPASKGPFTITDSYGATAITSVGDGLAVSPNIRTQSAPQTQTSPPQPTAIIDYEKLAQVMSRVTVQSNLDGVAVSSRLQTPMGIATRKI